MKRTGGLRWLEKGRLTAGAPLVLASLLFSCSGSGKSNVGERSSDEEAGETPSGSARTVAVPSPGLPDKVDSLAEAVPEQASVFVALPSLGAIGLPKQTLEQLLDATLPELAKGSGVPLATLKGLIDGFDGGVGFVLGNFDLKGPPPIAVALRFRDGSPIEGLIRDLKLRSVGEGRWVLEKGSDKAHVAWLPKPGLLIVSQREEVLVASLDTLSKKTASFASSEHQQATAGGGGLSAFVDLHRLLPKATELAAPGSRVVARVSLDDSEIKLFEYGEKVPRFGSVVAPSGHPALATLPSGAVMAMDLSLRRSPGKALRDVIMELARPASASPSSVPDEADRGLKNFGLSLADFDAALGDSVAVGAYLPAGGGALGGETVERGALLIALQTKDDAAASKIFDAVAGQLTRDKNVKFTPGQLKGTIGKQRLGWSARTHKGSISIAIGQLALIDSLNASYAGHKDVLSSSPSFASFKKSALPESHLAIYVDADNLAKVTGQSMAFASGVMSGDLLAAASDKGLELTLRGGASVAVLGTMSALAIYGVRRYIASSKTSEAKNSVGAIARGAVSAYERETTAPSGSFSHALCKSSTPVPAAVPQGKKYQPDSSPGKDFETGDALSGWKCLKFTITQPTYYRYEYRLGGRSKRGDVLGPNEFEISAEGDLDGDGQTSLFTQRGSVNTTTQSVRLATELTITDEFE